MAEQKVYRLISKHPQEAVTLNTGYRVPFNNWSYVTDIDKIQKMIERSTTFQSGRIYLAEAKASPGGGPDVARSIISTETAPKIAKTKESKKNEQT